MFNLYFMQYCKNITTIIKAANGENLSRHSLESFSRCTNIYSLRESQYHALYSFISGEEVFVNSLDMGDVVRFDWKSFRILVNSPTLRSIRLHT